MIVSYQGERWVAARRPCLFSPAHIDLDETNLNLPVQGEHWKAVRQLRLFLPAVILLTSKCPLQPNLPAQGEHWKAVRRLRLSPAEMACMGAAACRDVRLRHLQLEGEGFV